MTFGNVKVDTITSSTRTISVDEIFAENSGNAVVFVAASGVAPLSVSGSPISSSGTLTISLDQSALSIAPSQLTSGALPSGVTVASTNIVDGTIVDGDISNGAAIDPAKISGVAVVSGDTRLSDERAPLDGSVTNVKVASGAAIELSKLADGALPSGITVASTNIVNGTIVDTDINASAAIALTKLASGTLPSGIAIASGTQASTNLSYDTASRALSSSTGSGTTIPLVTSSEAGLVPAFGTPTGQVFTDGGWAAPSAGGTPGGSSGQLQFNNGGAFGGVSTSSIDGSGNMTFSGRWIQSVNGAASAPSMALTGTWFTGGTSTTTKPQLVIEPAGATSTGWSTAGTGLGVNAASDFAGNLLDLQVDGTKRARIGWNGAFSFFHTSNQEVLFDGSALKIARNTSTTPSVTITADHTYQFRLAFPVSINWTSGNSDASVDLSLRRDAANTLAQRNGTNAQAFRVYNTYTSDTNFERLYVRWTSNEAIIDTEAGSGGGTLRGLKIGSAGTSLLGFYGATPVVRPAAVADATDAASVITQLNALLSRLRTIGLIAT